MPQRAVCCVTVCGRPPDCITDSRQWIDALCAAAFALCTRQAFGTRAALCGRSGDALAVGRDCDPSLGSRKTRETCWPETRLVDLHDAARQPRRPPSARARAAAIVARERSLQVKGRCPEAARRHDAGDRVSGLYEGCESAHEPFKTPICVSAGAALRVRMVGDRPSTAPSC
jgi:hypothetical protein